MPSTRGNRTASTLNANAEFAIERIVNEGARLPDGRPPGPDDVIPHTFTLRVTDVDGKVGRAYAARTTPHMYVIDKAGTLVYEFEMPQPIPGYLLALAVRNFYFAPLGEDTGVYTEPELLDASVYEFADTQAMLEQAETDGHKAKRMFGYAVKAEKVHADLYKKALAAVARDRGWFSLATLAEPVPETVGALR